MFAGACAEASFCTPVAHFQQISYFEAGGSPSWWRCFTAFLPQPRAPPPLDVCLLLVNLQVPWPPANQQPDERLATFAGGCFWSVELAFQVRQAGLACCAIEAAANALCRYCSRAGIACTTLNKVLSGFGSLCLQRVPGVVATCVGYAQGSTSNPTYEQVGCAAGGCLPAPPSPARQHASRMYAFLAAPQWLNTPFLLVRFYSPRFAQAAQVTQRRCS